MAFLATHPLGLGAPLAVVIPAYNEEPTVAGVVAEIPREAAGLKLEVIVVVDGARDATASKAAGAGALVCDVPVNRGQGAALKLGYWLARARGAKVIATIDADGQYEPRSWPAWSSRSSRTRRISSQAPGDSAPSSRPTARVTWGCSCSAR